MRKGGRGGAGRRAGRWRRTRPAGGGARRWLRPAHRSMGQATARGRQGQWPEHALPRCARPAHRSRAGHGRCVAEDGGPGRQTGWWGQTTARVQGLKPKGRVRRTPSAELAVGVEVVGTESTPSLTDGRWRGGGWVVAVGRVAVVGREVVPSLADGRHPRSWMGDGGQGGGWAVALGGVD
jgi:hypothetical protein